MCEKIDEQNKKNVRASGISEGVSEADQLLDELMFEMQEFKEGVRKKRDEQTNFEQQLEAAGEEVQARALARSTRTPNTTPKKKRQSHADDQFLEFIEEMKEDFKEMEKLRTEELEVNKRHIELQEKRFEEEKKERDARNAAQSATLDLLKALTDKLK